MAFVEGSGEAGNSGTLMFQLEKDGTRKVIGVYLGTTTRNAPSVKDQKAKDVKVRGAICPLWKVNDFGKHSPSENEPDFYQIHTGNESLFLFFYGGSTFKKVIPSTGKAYYHNDKLGYGILVNKLSDAAKAAEAAARQTAASGDLESRAPS